jgi:hypothetical protein
MATSSAVADPGSADVIAGVVSAGIVVVVVAGARADAGSAGIGVMPARACCQAVMPWRVRTARPSGNASARACRAAWRSCS